MSRSRRPRPLDVAIVGMACRFAGAEDLRTFWRNILEGRDGTGEVPVGRWDPDVFSDPESTSSDRLGCRRGGYLGSSVPFDPAAHGIMPLAVAGGDPEQFLILGAAMSALSDSGIDVGAIDRSRVEVIIGRGNDLNRGNLTRLQHGRIVTQTVQILAALHPEWSEADLDTLRDDLKASLPPLEAATVPGQLINATAGRVAQRLGLTGSAFDVDAAGASSLVALDLASRSLASRRADLALVGAVHLEADVDVPSIFQQRGTLSKSGVSRPFSEDADGLLCGEGVGLVVLKRLADAECDGDRVYAVLKGVGIAGDAAASGLASPDARGHARAIRRAYRRSGVDPRTVGLIEGHGLCLPDADRAELRAIRAAFPTPDVGSRALGAVSSMIGHAMPAAGMAGLIKAALALFHRALPPTLHAERPHALLRRPDFPASLNAALRPWVHGRRASPRRAGINAFGFAGINAHAILEEHIASAEGPRGGALPSWDSEAILLAAPDRAGLADRAERLRDWLLRSPGADLKDLAATLNSGDPAAAGPARLGLVARSTADLADRLGAVRDRLLDAALPAVRDARGAYYWDRPVGLEGGLAFLFPGEGSQYPGMMADLCLHFPEVLAQFDTSDRIALESGERALPSDLLFDTSAGDAESAYRSAEIAVNVVLSSQWAIERLLRRLAIRPDASAGHSSGELLALAAAGALEVDATLEGRLGRLGAIFRDLERSGSVPEARLVAAATDRDRASAVCTSVDPRVRIAVDNCPHQVILAGPPDAVEAVVARLRGMGVLCDDLPFGRAYHTPAFAPAVGPIERFFDDLPLAAPRIPLYSCSIARRMPDDPEAIRRIAAGQWTRPVAFRETVEAMHDDGIRVFVDVGARGSLAGFVDDILRGRPAFAAAAHVPRRSGINQLNHLVAALFAQHVPLRADHLYQRRRPALLDLGAPIPTPLPGPILPLGFPEMRPSDAIVRRLRGGGVSRPTGPNRIVDHLGADARIFENVDENSDPVEPDPAPSGDDPMLAYLATMDAFLRTQREIVAGALGGDVLNGPGSAASEGMLAEFGGTTVAVGTAAEAKGGPGMPDSGPWAGLIRELGDAHVVTELELDAEGDPVAENHTLGGRRVSAIDPGRRGLPVLPFSVMAEMVAQVGALLAPHSAVLVGLRGVRAHRWVRFEDEPITLELRGDRVEGQPVAVRVAIINRDGGGHGAEAEAPVFEGVAVFGAARSDAPTATIPRLKHAGPSRFTAEALYGEQWLFHGPVLRALDEVGGFGPGGIEGSIRVLPRSRLFRDGVAPRLLSDPIVLDTFTHLLGCWGLDALADKGDVVFPLGMEELAIFGDDPAEGTRLDCRIAVRAVERHRIRADAEILRPDGGVWMRIDGWEDWRFHWPGRYRDVFRAPDATFLGVPLELGDDAPPGLAAVWLEPPADMGRPVWRDVLEQTQLGPSERAAFLDVNTRGPEARRARRLWGRIAAKEAARRLRRAAGVPSEFPADLAIVPDEHGRPRLVRADDPTRHDLPAVSIAHTEGVAVALASADPTSCIGIDVELIVDRSESFEALAFSEAERALLGGRMGIDRTEWVARLWCAKEAAAKATGFGLVSGPSSVAVIDLDDATGALSVRLGPELAARCPDLASGPLDVHSRRREGYAWAWTSANPGRNPR